MIDYTVVTRGDQFALVDTVNELMREGYEPIGGVSVSHIGLTQALLKKKAAPRKKARTKSAS
jgi:hypothetical protein